MPPKLTIFYYPISYTPILNAYYPLTYFKMDEYNFILNCNKNFLLTLLNLMICFRERGQSPEKANLHRYHSTTNVGLIKA